MLTHSLFIVKSIFSSISIFAAKEVTAIMVGSSILGRSPSYVKVSGGNDILTDEYHFVNIRLHQQHHISITALKSDKMDVFPLLDTKETPTMYYEFL